jgi:hypothetical protein
MMLQIEFLILKSGPVLVFIPGSGLHKNVRWPRTGENNFQLFSPV